LLEQIIRRPLDNPGAPKLRANVPCGTRRRCCRGGSLVMLLEREGDDIASYVHELVDLPGAGPRHDPEAAAERGLRLSC
jgi:hypothetical protein